MKYFDLIKRHVYPSGAGQTALGGIEAEAPRMLMADWGKPHCEPMEASGRTLGASYSPDRSGALLDYLNAGQFTQGS